MKVRIRKAVAHDATAIAGIHCRSWDAAYTGFLPSWFIASKNSGRAAMWKDSLATDHNTYCALGRNGPAGFVALLSPCRDRDIEDGGEIGALYVSPECQGQGIGACLLDFGARVLRDLGHERAVLWVLEENPHARHVYAKYGFIPDGARKEVAPGLEVMEIRYRLNLA